MACSDLSCLHDEWFSLEDFASIRREQAVRLRARLTVVPDHGANMLALYSSKLRMLEPGT